MSPKGGIKPHKRFSVQSNRSEVLFVDYIAEHLTTSGRAAVIVPEGIIFQGGTAYKQLRKMLVDKYLYAVVSLPAGVFNPYSGVKTSILFLDPVLAQKSDSILFVKIENDGFSLGAQRRAIDKNDLPGAVKIIKEFRKELTQRRKGAKDAEGNNYLIVSKEKIAESGEYNLSGERYREKEQRGKQKWPMVRLEDVFKLTSGRFLPQKDQIMGDYNVYGGNGVTGKHNDFFIDNPTLIIGRVGENCGTVHITDPKSWVTDNALLVNEYLVSIEPYYLLQILKKLNLNSYAKRGGQPSISQTTIYGLSIPLPPIEVQREIVAEIEGYRKIIDGAKQVVDNWKPYIDIDPDWPMVKLGEIAKPEYGFTETAANSGDARFIRITDIAPNGTLRSDDVKFIKITSEARESILKKDDILVARTGATFGKTMIFEEDYPAVFASYLIRLRFQKKHVLPRFYWIFAQSDLYWNQAKTLVTGGGQPQFNGNALVQIIIPLPPIETQHAIIMEIEAEQKAVDSCRKLIALYEGKIKTVIERVWGE